MGLSQSQGRGITSIPADKHLYRFLDLNGDGTGSKNAIGDYTIAQEIFYIQPSAGEVYTINRIIIHIDDAGDPRNDLYGNSVDLSAGGDGVSLRVQNDSGTLLDLMDGTQVKTNKDWAKYNFDLGEPNFTGAGVKGVVIRWTFAKAGFPIVLNGSNNERLEWLLDGDFSVSLVHNRIMAEGYIS